MMMGGGPGGPGANNQSALALLEAMPPRPPPGAAYLEPLALPPRGPQHMQGGMGGMGGGGGLGPVVVLRQSASADGGRLEERLAALEARAAVAEQRASSAEQRAAALERGAGEVARSHDIQNQRLAAVSGELARAAAELGDLRLRHEGAHASQAQVAQQVGGRGGVGAWEGEGEGVYRVLVRVYGILGCG